LLLKPISIFIPFDKDDGIIAMIHSQGSVDNVEYNNIGIYTHIFMYEYVWLCIYIYMHIYVYIYNTNIHIFAMIHSVRSVDNVEYNDIKTHQLYCF
jgi:hypothetical protein